MNIMTKSKTILKLIPLETDKDLSHLHQEDENSYPNETYTGIASLCTLLKGIQDRLIREGYCIIEKQGSSHQRVIHYESKTINT